MAHPHAEAFAGNVRQRTTVLSLFRLASGTIAMRFTDLILRTDHQLFSNEGTSTEMTELTAAYLFGMTLAIAVGPIALLIINNGLQYGWTMAMRSAMGAASGDFLYALLTFIIGTLLFQYLHQYENQIQIISSSILIIIALHMFRYAKPEETEPKKHTRRSFYRTTLLLTLANPLTILVFMGLLGSSNVSLNLTNAFILSCSLFLGSLTIQVIFAISGAYAGQRLTDPNHRHKLQILSSVGAFLFGIKGFITLT